MNARRNVLAAELMVQIIPSLSDGLRYAIFVKKIDA